MMRHMTFGDEQESYDIAILTPRLDRGAIEKYYLEPYIQDKTKVVALTLEQTGKKTPVKAQKEYLTELIPVLKDLRVKYLVVCDADYFKTITKSPKAEPLLGYVVPVGCDIAVQLGYEPMAVYCPNFGSVFYDPEKALPKIGAAWTALAQHMDSSYEAPGSGIIHFAAYPSAPAEIHQWLQRLLDTVGPGGTLTADIEGFSLKHYDAGIGTISFAWSKHEGIAFPVDLGPDGTGTRALLRAFFEACYQLDITIIWHNISYDVYVLIYQLFMAHILDTEGLLRGLEIMLSHWEDTKLITYLATNSCAGNKLGLKDQAQEFAGNYAVEDIKDIRRIPLDQLLQYNLVDACSTWYVYEKHWDRMVADDQLQIYTELFKPAIVDIIQMQLTGLPLDMEEVIKAKAEMVADEQQALADIFALPVVEDYIQYRRQQHVLKRNAEMVKKRISLTDEETLKVTYNPGSDPQTRYLLYTLLGLPEIDLTDSGLPSTGKDTLKSLRNHTREPQVLALLDALLRLADVSIILTTFIPAFERAFQGPDGWHYLFGNFNLGGTLSGRLSSSDPNLQNIPANSKYAKVIKRCFKAPPGWLFVGLDFASLEDRISALTTRDPNKLKVYTDGYDGHSLRAYAYFGSEMPDIDPNSVESINSIAKKYPTWRQDSKAPTFALTYQGTFKTLMNNCGFTHNMAIMIESKYHELYVVSDAWVAEKLKGASQTGFITAAFGLRVRTPLLRQVVWGAKKVPYEAAAEGRTAGNALGQSWCLLNSRAGIEFNGKVRRSKYRLDIRPCAQIHDAQYHIIRDDVQTVLWYNEHLVKAAEWQDHPDIWHPDVGLGGEVDIFYPNWAHGLTIPNGADEATLEAKTQEHVTKLLEKGVL